MEGEGEESALQINLLWDGGDVQVRVIQTASASSSLRGGPVLEHQHRLPVSLPRPFCDALQQVLQFLAQAGGNPAKGERVPAREHQQITRAERAYSGDDYEVLGPLQQITAPDRGSEELVKEVVLLLPGQLRAERAALLRLIHRVRAHPLRIQDAPGKSRRPTASLG